MVDKPLPPLTPLEHAVEQILQQVQPVAGAEYVALENCLGRILAEDQRARCAVPAADNSAMDGYALNSQDLELGINKFYLAQRIAAGSVGVPLERRQAARIFTGAPIPPGADIVVIQEQCRRDGDFVIIDAGVLQQLRSGQNIRRAGEDIALDSVALPRGSRLRAQEIGLLASIGVAQVPVFAALKIALISTGDELVEVGKSLAPGQIYNSNRYTLTALIEGLGLHVHTADWVPDKSQCLQQHIQDIADDVDCVISSGGVSVGEEDHVVNTIEKLGRLQLWRMALKPGKPLAFGFINSAGREIPYFGLPGNPAAVLATFCLVVRPYLLKMNGANAYEPSYISAPADFDKPSTAKRTEYLRARLAANEQGKFVIQSYPNQSSGLLSSACWANGFAVIEAGTEVRKGDEIPFLLFSEVMS